MVTVTKIRFSLKILHGCHYETCELNLLIKKLNWSFEDNFSLNSKQIFWGTREFIKIAIPTNILYNFEQGVLRSKGSNL